jgi:hypothetical protein
MRLGKISRAVLIGGTVLFGLVCIGLTAQQDKYSLKCQACAVSRTAVPAAPGAWRTTKVETRPPSI